MNIVFDLDGTLADCRHRVHFVTGEEKDWDSFYGACIYDEPIKAMVDLFRDLRGTNHIEIWTGRPERIRRPTALRRWH